MSQSDNIVSYKRDQLQELVCASILKNKQAYHVVDSSKTRSLPQELKEGETKQVIVYGGYYNHETLCDFATKYNIPKVLIIMFEAELKAKEYPETINVSQKYTSNFIPEENLTTIKLEHPN